MFNSDEEVYAFWAGCVTSLIVIAVLNLMQVIMNKLALSPKKQWTVDQRAVAIELKAHGAPVDYIAQVLNTTRNNVNCYMSSHNLNEQAAERKLELLQEVVDSFKILTEP